jgi:hypothetical protein
MKRLILAAVASLALTGVASAQIIQVDGDDEETVERTYRAPVPPRAIGPDHETEVIVRRPPARHVDDERGGVIIHERIVTERTIRPANPDYRERADWRERPDWRERTDWRERAEWRGRADDEDEDDTPRRKVIYGGGYDGDPRPVVLGRPVVVGAVIPPTIVLKPVPPRYGFAGYHWVADPHGRRVLVEPQTRRVVRIVERW